MDVRKQSSVAWLLLTFTLPTKRASQRVEVWRKIATLRNRAAGKLRIPAAEQSGERRTLSVAGHGHSEIRRRCLHRSRAGDRQYLDAAIDGAICGGTRGGVPGVDSAT